VFGVVADVATKENVCADAGRAQRIEGTNLGGRKRTTRVGEADSPSAVTAGPHTHDPAGKRKLSPPVRHHAEVG
jgi:hypothetical protein